jgi:hypothetical protein
MIIKGDLYLKGCENLESLGELEEVRGDLNLSGCLNLKSLGNLKKVGGDLYLWDCELLKHLGFLEHVGGKISVLQSGISEKLEKEFKSRLIKKHRSLKEK